jgi:glutathione S-transferase
MKYLAYFEKAIMENPGSSWLIGPTITIADLYLYDFLQFIIQSRSSEDQDHKKWDGFPDIIMDFPMLKNHMNEIENLPAVASFRSKFQPPYQTFAFRPTV